MGEQGRNIYPVTAGQKRGDVAEVWASTAPGYPAEVALAGYGCTYLVRAGRTPSGSVLLSLRVEPLEGNTLTDYDLAVPVRRLAAAAVRAGLVAPEDDHGGPEDEAVDWSRIARPEQAKTGRPVERGPEHYAEVAGVTRSAWLDGLAARDEVAARWTVAGQTADEWIRTARRMGLVGTYAEVKAQRTSGAPTGKGGDGV